MMREQANTQDVSGKHLLLVEDEAVIAMATKRTLEKHGFAVTTANTGEKAVEAVTDGAGIDLILMDIDLGSGIDGTQAAEKILETYDVPIVFLTSHSEKEYVDRVKKIAGYGYVLKNSGEFVLVESVNMAFTLFDARKREEEKEQQLREQNAHLDFYRLAVDAMDDQKVSIVDSDYRYRIVSERYAKDFGLPKEKIVGKTVGELLGNDAFQAIRPEIERCFAGESGKYSKWFDFPATGKRYMEVFHEPLVRNETGEIECIAAIITDRTEEKHAKDQLENALEFQKIIANISSRLVKTTEESFDEDVDAMLAEIGEHFGVDRSYVSRFSDDLETVTATHEWCKEGVSSQVQNFLQSEPIKSFPWWASQIFSQDFLHVPDVEALPDRAEKKQWEREGTKSLLVVPVKCGDQIQGSVGFDAVAKHYRWSSHEIENLMTIAGNLGHLLLRLRSERMLKEAKRKAEESEARLSTLLQTVPDIVFFIDEEDRLVDVYTGDINQLYRPPETFLGCKVAEVVPEHVSEVFLTAVAAARGEQGTQRAEYLLEVPKGERWFEASTAQVDTALKESSVVDVVVVVRDITGRKQTEEKLREREQLLESIVENGIDEMIITDLEGRALFANQSGCRVWGVAPEQIEGVPIFDTVPPQDKDRIRDEFFAFVQGGERVNRRRVRRVLPDGSTSWGDVVGVLLTDETGVTERVLVITRDISEAKRREEQIQALLQQKELLLKETHHRVKNHLTSVTSLLTLQAGDDRHETVRRPILEAANRVQALAQLYEKLFRSEGNGSASARAYLGELVAESIRILDPRGDVAHSVEIDENLILEANRLAQLGIIVSELITNSMKYAFGETESPRVTLELHAQDGHAVFAYRDNGPGLPETVNVESAESFGIQLLQMLTSQLEGSLSVQSENGTEFRIEFPCC